MTTLLLPEQIRTASLYPLKTLAERTEGTARILVTRYWPRGLKRERVDSRWPLVAPDAIALKCYKAGLWNWHSFATNYTAQLWVCAPTIRFDISLMLKRYGAITLLCHEHDAPEETVRCHRRLLRDMLLETTGGDGNDR